MDSPETDKITTTSSGSPPVNDSPIFSYISNLSPIKPVKAAHVAQGFPGLNSPPLVFTSPRIHTHRETSFLKRPQYPQSSTQYDGGGKKITVGPHVSMKPDSQLSSGLITCIEKECDIKGSAQDQPCSSSGCVDEYLADPIEVDCANSAHSANLSFKKSDDMPQSSQSGFTDLKRTITKLDDKNDIIKDAKTEVGAFSAILEQAHLRGKSTSEVKQVETERKQMGGERPSNDYLNIEYNFSVDQASKEKQCEHLVSQNAGSGHQDECDGTSQLPPESLQIVQAYEDCHVNSGGISNGPVENTMLHESEASQHQRGMRRRCLQFEEAQRNSITNSPGSGNPTISVTNSRSPASPTDSEILESSRVELNATSSNRKSVNLSQPIISMVSPRNSGNSPLTVSKPSGIGLHLNSIVNAVPVVCGASASMKSTVKGYLSVQGIKSTPILSCHLPENIKSTSISSNVIEEVSVSAEDGRHETLASIAASSATSLSPHDMKPLNNPLLLKPSEQPTTPYDKRKFNSIHADSVEEINQLSPKKKRKKASSTIDDDGCKRCNCKKTKCLKLYCDCFAAGIYCAEPCACQGCFNKPEYEDTVLETRQQIESRNPFAFAPKIVPRVTESPANSGEGGNMMTPSSARHKRGCNCKKSMCLKKYCECYQANVGCSDGCRCEGCKNVHGRKEEYGVTKEMMNKRANDERLGGKFNEKLEMVAAKSNFLHIELCNPHSLSPLTPSFQCSDHRNDARKSQFPSRTYLPSPESDLTILSSNGKSPRSPRNSDNRDMLLTTSEDILDIVSCDQELDYGNTETVDQFSPRCDGLANVCHLTPLPNLPLMVMASSSSSRTSERTNVSRAQLFPGSGRFSSGGSLRWRSSPITPMTRLGGTKILEGLDSDSRLYDILEDDTPEILKDSSTSVKAVKASSPNQKRVSPPHSCLHELGSSSSAGLRSGRKFILQAVPSFPPLTPCIDSKGSTNQNKSDLQDSCNNK